MNQSTSQSIIQSINRVLLCCRQKETMILDGMVFMSNLIFVLRSVFQLIVQNVLNGIFILVKKLLELHYF